MSLLIQVYVHIGIIPAIYRLTAFKGYSILSMWFNDNPSKRLFCLILVALFVPAIAVGLQYGPSKQLVHSLMLNFAIPIIMIVISQGNVGIIVAAQLVGLAAFIHAVWLLCLARNQSSPGGDFDLEGAAPPPVYEEPPAPVAPAPKSGAA